MRKLLIFSLILFMSSASVIAQVKARSPLLPDHVSLQYAGSIGYMSLGMGYHLFKEKASLSLHYGYVPEVKGGELHIAAVKFEYKPFAIKLGNKLILHPINPTVFASYTFAEHLGFKFNRDQYPKGYYFWSPSLREHLALNTELKILGDPGSQIKSISLFAEANTNDLYLISWFENRTSTPIRDIFHMGFGVRMNF